MAMSKFGKAFAEARKAGKKNFSFGGKSYNTKRADDVPVPANKPQSGPGRKPTGPQPSTKGMASVTGRKPTPPIKTVTDRMPSSISMPGAKQFMPDASVGRQNQPVVLKDPIFPSEYSNKIRDARARKADRKPQEKL